jgi:hypothetical protein
MSRFRNSRGGISGIAGLAGWRNETVLLFPRISPDSYHDSPVRDDGSKGRDPSGDSGRATDCPRRHSVCRRVSRAERAIRVHPVAGLVHRRLRRSRTSRRCSARRSRLRIDVTRGVFANAVAGKVRPPSHPAIPLIPPPKSKRRAGPFGLPAVSAPVTRSQGIDSPVLLPAATAWAVTPAGGRLGAPASIPMRSGRTTRFAGASAASRIGSRTDPSHCTPRRYIGVDEATRLASPVRVGATARIVGRLSP